jgi:succinoglycan biosynthesis transport protein ExoP
MSEQQMSSSSPAPAAAAAYTPSHAADHDTHLLDRFAILAKYRYPTVAMFLAVVAWFMLDSYTTVPIYRATAQIQIDEESVGLGTPAEIAQNFVQPDPEVYFNTQFRIIAGRELGRRVAKKLNLRQVPEYNGQGAQPTPLAQTITRVKRTAMWPVRAVLGIDDPVPTMPPASAASAGDDDSAYVDLFVSRIDVAPVRGSRLVNVHFNSTDSAFAVRAVNTIVEEYVAQNLALKLEVLDKSLSWLTAEVARQAQQVQISERALAEYREQKDAGALADNQNIVIARLNTLNTNYTDTRNQRIAKESVWNQVREAGRDRDALSVVIQNPRVQALKTQLQDAQRERTRLADRYGPKWPDIQKIDGQIAQLESQFASEVQKAAQNAEAEYKQALAQEQSLQRDLSSQQSAATSLNRKNIDYTVLQRAAETNSLIYNQLLTREKELRVIANSRANNVRVVDTARQAGRQSPNHRQDWIYALFFATALAMAVAFGLDYLDDTVKTPEDISRRLKLKFLGLVPVVRGQGNPLLSGPVPHDFGEAFRSLRTALVANAPIEGPKIIAITSAQPLEGKTTTAVNMAMALAVGGARVLLIDADMRRPNVHKTLRMSNDHGLSQLLAGHARMREVVQRSHDPNLLVISAGRTPSNPSELLASDRMRALIAGLEAGPFDWIVVDTPPVLAVTDAVIVAPLVESMVFVIGAEMTRWRLAQRAVDTIMAGNPRSVSAVLNKVDFQRNKYYYSRYYGHQYKSYYQEAPAA